ncbi:MAG: hypothetical protein ACLQU4_00605 [Limisphaerales bacterium]
MQTLENESEVILNRTRAIADMRAAHPRWTDAQIRSQIRQQHPELFGLESHSERAARESAAASTRNRANDSMQPRKIEDAIEELRRKDKSLTYVQARNQVRVSNPALFGL